MKKFLVIFFFAFHPKIRGNKGSNLRVKFVFYTAAIKMTELGRMSRSRRGYYVIALTTTTTTKG